MFYIISILIILYMFFVKTNKKYLFLKSLIFGLLFGIIAYNLIPRETYDILSHQKVVFIFMNSRSISTLKYVLATNELEFLPIIYSYFISFFNDIHLTQFIIVVLGYSIIFYLLIDYLSENNICKLYSISIMLFIVFGFYAINFMSGLYYYIGVIFFALAFYLDYYKKHFNKASAYILYIIAFLSHDTLLFPIALVIMFKFFRNKLNLKTIILVLLVIPFSYSILNYIYDVYQFSFLVPILKIYTAYLNNGLRMKKFYDGYVYYLEISKLIYTLVIVILIRKDESIKEFNNYLLILIASTIMMMTKSIVMIRFVMLIHFIGIVPIVKYFKTRKNNIIMYFSMFTLLLFYVIYFFHVMGEQSYNFIF